MFTQQPQGTMRPVFGLAALGWNQLTSPTRCLSAENYEMDNFGIQEIEIISVGVTKIAAYAIGQPVWHLSDWRGMNMRIKRLSPLFNRNEVELCKQWVRDNLVSLDFIYEPAGKRKGWEVYGLGSHYEGATKGREVVDEMSFNAYAADPFALSNVPA